LAAAPETTPVIHDVPRAQRLLALEFGSRAEFEDPRLEYRRLFSEVLGTFMLVVVAAGGGLLHAKGQEGRDQAHRRRAQTPAPMKLAS
jgi:aquaporin Z